jgi:sugar phosphate isomerase/epimerase
MSLSRSGTLLGYCTNVHAGLDSDSILANLRKCALPVRQRLGQDRLGVGLWFSQVASKELLEEDRLDRFKQQLQSMGLVPYTINGFPQQDFHQKVVKHRVYEPAWWEPARLQYTRDLVEILDRLLPEGLSGSISTLPIGWNQRCTDQESRYAQAAANLLVLADELDARYEKTGRRIRIALEPEPGCIFTDNASLRAFYQRYWSTPAISHAQSQRAREYLTICHDICHSAVMGENQHEQVLESLSLGIQVGKVQVSSAIRVPWSRLDSVQQHRALLQLAQFAEDRYLHQTMVVDSTGQHRLVEDLPELMAQHLEHGALKSTLPLSDREWRIHFHVPIYVQSWGQIESTQSQIEAWLDLVKVRPELFLPDVAYEVETYAWGVLPSQLQRLSLDEGIAQEIAWLQSQL